MTYAQAWDNQRAAAAERRVSAGGGGARSEAWTTEDQDRCMARIIRAGRTEDGLLTWAKDYGLALGRKFEDRDLAVEQGDYLRAAACVWMDTYTADFEFVLKVREAWHRDEQIGWGAIRGILNCMRAEAEREERALREEAFRPAFPGVPAMFDAAIASGLKRPMFRMRTTEPEPREFTVAPAERGDRYYVKLDWAYVGYLDRAGEVDTRLERIPPVLEALTLIEADPKGAFAAYGKATGQCGVCGRKLSDPESVRLGIGPICAGRMGW